MSLPIDGALVRMSRAFIDSDLIRSFDPCGPIQLGLRTLSISAVLPSLRIFFAKLSGVALSVLYDALPLRQFLPHRRLPLSSVFFVKLLMARFGQAVG